MKHHKILWTWQLKSNSIVSSRTCCATLYKFLSDEYVQPTQTFNDPKSRFIDTTLVKDKKLVQQP